MRPQQAPVFRKVFIRRDYSSGTRCQFQTKFPAELENRIDRQQFEETVRTLNNLYAEAEKLGGQSYLEGCLACLTAYTIFLCMETHYEKQEGCSADEWAPDAGLTAGKCCCGGTTLSCRYSPCAPERGPGSRPSGARMNGTGAQPSSGFSPTICCFPHYFVLCGIDTDSRLEPDKLVLRKVSKYIQEQNEKIYAPQGLLLTDPIERGLRVVWAKPENLHSSRVPNALAGGLVLRFKNQRLLVLEVAAIAEAPADEGAKGTQEQWVEMTQDVKWPDFNRPQFPVQTATRGEGVERAWKADTTVSPQPRW
ncbi:Golgin subfamily A member 7 [Myotis davidii]|uniref:Golgin subfamily A member 7 n=1 Tax=Myotis davidii TaxID=225400 RepID=L5LQV8_MYODS|nr:Golgin subfamily A member 7 [Myotis davidii]